VCSNRERYTHWVPNELHQAKTVSKLSSQNRSRSVGREANLDIGFPLEHPVDTVEMLADNRFCAEVSQGGWVAQVSPWRVGVVDWFMLDDEKIRVNRL
jgi:hypothetical protein